MRSPFRYCKTSPEVIRLAQFDHGLAFVHFPEGKGGLDLAPRQQQTVDDELRLRTETRYRNSSVNLIGIGMAAPTLLTYASEELQQRFLRPIFTGEEIWCQLFSEPGAGSDVHPADGHCGTRGGYLVSPRADLGPG